MAKHVQCIKQFKGILEDEPHRKTKLLNMRNAAFKQVKFILKKDGVNTNAKKVFLVGLFCEKFRLNDIPISRKLTDRWLVEKWLDKNFDFLGPKNERNYSYHEWNNLKKQVFNYYEHKCMWCYSTEDLTVDHIKPYAIYPELSLDFDNMQILCRSCNSKKGIKVIDFRKPINIKQ